jgi:hypothetical protein
MNSHSKRNENEKNAMSFLNSSDGADRIFEILDRKCFPANSRIGGERE